MAWCGWASRGWARRRGAGRVGSTRGYPVQGVCFSEATITAHQAELLWQALSENVLPAELIAARIGVPLHSVFGFSDATDNYGYLPDDVADAYAPLTHQQYAAGYLAGLKRRDEAYEASREAKVAAEAA